MNYDSLLSSITRVVATYFRMTPTELQVGSGGGRECVQARRFALLAIRRIAPGITWSTLAEHFGYRGHGAAVQQCGEIEAWLHVDGAMRAEFDAVMALIRSEIPSIA